MTEREKKMLFKVVERYQFHEGACKSENPLTRETAQKMCDIELWEMWVLTQK